MLIFLLRKLENLYILNLNEAAIHLDECVTVEMQRLRTQAVLQLSYMPLYKTDPCKIKLAFNNARSLHKHLKDIQWEPNVLAADVIGFAESRLCLRDEAVHFALNKFRLIRMWDLIVSVPDHCLSFYLLDYLKQHMKLDHIMDLLCM